MNNLEALLFEAVILEHVAGVKLLLEKGATVYSSTLSYSRGKNKEIFEMLLWNYGPTKYNSFLGFFP